MKVYICCKTLSNRIRIQNSVFESRNQGRPISLLEEIKVKIMKVLHVKCAPFTGIIKGIVMAHNNISFLDTGNITDLSDQWI